MDVRLIRSVTHPTGRGPGNGMFALQQALQKAKLSWLHIGGVLREWEIPWFWSWEDRAEACACAAVKWPFVLGPNVLFVDSRRPGAFAGEGELCNAESCRLLFTESAWYRELIRAHCGPEMRAPIVLWPYPIEPTPDGPLASDLALLMYAKSGFDGEVVRRLLQQWPSSACVRYGHYGRDRLIELARRSRACLYLSDDDRGPLALAEILICGCPAVGVRRGAPWIDEGQTGYFVDRFDVSSIAEAIERAMRLDRLAVRSAALKRFDTGAIVRTIVAALEAARCF
jgi:glycosyltransferase involved in cell wall biosynthesis